MGKKGAKKLLEKQLHQDQEQRNQNLKTNEFFILFLLKTIHIHALHANEKEVLT